MRRNSSKTPKERHKDRMFTGAVAVLVSATTIAVLAGVIYEVHADVVAAWGIAVGVFVGLVVLSYLAGYVLLDLPDDIERWRGGGR